MGGYQIIDLEGKNFALGDGANTIVVSGIYEKVKDFRKPFIVTGLVIDGGEIPNIFVNSYLDGESVSMFFFDMLGIIALVVTSDDTVTCIATDIDWSSLVNTTTDETLTD